MRRLTPPRLVAAVVVVAFLVSLAATDPVAAGITVVGGLAVGLALRHRSRSASRRALLAVIAGATGVAGPGPPAPPSAHAPAAPPLPPPPRPPRPPRPPPPRPPPRRGR